MFFCGFADALGGCVFACSTGRGQRSRSVATTQRTALLAQKAL